MDYDPYVEDDYPTASEYLRLALGLLGKHQVPPSPLNFRIGYDCAAGKSFELIEKLNQLKSDSMDSAHDQFWGFYKQFYVQDHEAFDLIRRELKQMVGQVQEEFQNSGKQLEGYSSTLDGFARVLDGNTDANTMKSEVQRVVQDTRAMQSSQDQMTSSLAQILKEVGDLKKELEQVKEASNTDSLTGISNRKAFDSALVSTILQAQEKGQQFSLLLIDIDHFKKFNDTYGHLVGDKVLRFVASTMKRCLKGKDLAARYGGEEFGVILPNTGESGAMAIAEEIREAISAQRLKDSSRGKYYNKITASFGLGVYQEGEMPNDLIDRTDQALYQAKSEGRNRVVKAKK